MDTPKYPLKVKQLDREKLPGPNRKVVLKSHQIPGGELLNFGGGGNIVFTVGAYLGSISELPSTYTTSSWWKSGSGDASLAEGCMSASSK